VGITADNNLHTDNRFGGATPLITIDDLTPQRIVHTGVHLAMAFTSKARCHFASTTTTVKTADTERRSKSDAATGKLKE
jgi:hypothetical protein